MRNTKIGDTTQYLLQAIELESTPERIWVTTELGCRLVMIPSFGWKGLPRPLLLHKAAALPFSFTVTNHNHQRLPTVHHVS